MSVRRAPRGELKAPEKLTREELVDAVQKLRGMLKEVFTSADIDAGWNHATRLFVMDYCDNLERDLRSGACISFFSIIRTLDAMGISSNGPLLDEVCRVNNAANERA
jgi:hypothetical protein